MPRRYRATPQIAAELGKAIKALQPGDTLAVVEPDRLARSAWHLLGLVDALEAAVPPPAERCYIDERRVAERSHEVIECGDVSSSG
jgi:resolvase-like protein